MHAILKEFDEHFLLYYRIDKTLKVRRYFQDPIDQARGSQVAFFSSSERGGQTSYRISTRYL